MVSKVLESTASVIKASEGIPAGNLAVGFLGVIAVAAVVFLGVVVIFCVVR